MSIFGAIPLPFVRTSFPDTYFGSAYGVFRFPLLQALAASSIYPTLSPFDLADPGLLPSPINTSHSNQPAFGERLVLRTSLLRLIVPVAPLAVPSHPHGQNPRSITNDVRGDKYQILTTTLEAPN